MLIEGRGSGAELTARILPEVLLGDIAKIKFGEHHRLPRLCRFSLVVNPIDKTHTSIVHAHRGYPRHRPFFVSI